MRITSVSPSSAHMIPPDLLAVMARFRDPVDRTRFAVGRLLLFATVALFAFRVQ